MSLIGGFTLTGLLTVLGNGGDFSPSSLNYMTPLGVPASEVFYDELVAFLGTISIFSIVSALLMWLLASDLDPKRYRYTGQLATYLSIGVLLVATGGLPFLIQPFTHFVGGVLSFIWYGLTVLVVFVIGADAWRTRKMNTKSNTGNASK